MISAFSAFAGMMRPHCSRAISGSLRPWPVTVQTMREPSGMAGRGQTAQRSLPRHFSNPAMEAALAGSTKIPSRAARKRCASRMSRSLTISMAPWDSRMAVAASCQLAGLPMRMALATVSGLSTILS